MKNTSETQVGKCLHLMHGISTGDIDRMSHADAKILFKRLTDARRTERENLQSLYMNFPPGTLIRGTDPTHPAYGKIGRIGHRTWDDGTKAEGPQSLDELKKFEVLPEDTRPLPEQFPVGTWVRQIGSGYSLGTYGVAGVIMQHHANDRAEIHWENGELTTRRFLPHDFVVAAFAGRKPPWDIHHRTLTPEQFTAVLEKLKALQIGLRRQIPDQQLAAVKAARIEELKKLLNPDSGE